MPKYIKVTKVSMPVELLTPSILCNFIVNAEDSVFQWTDSPVATCRTNTVFNLMTGLNVCLLSAVDARILLWHLSTSLSSCFCNNTRMSSSSNVYRSRNKKAETVLSTEIEVCLINFPTIWQRKLFLANVANLKSWLVYCLP